MCSLVDNYAGKVGGWKVVAVDRKGNLRSVATGMYYPMDGSRLVPPLSGERLSCYFVPVLIEKKAYHDTMVGRTAVFVIKQSAYDLASEVRHGWLDRHTRPAVAHAEVSDEVMRGKYGGCPVAAGRRIRFLGEPELQW